MIRLGDLLIERPRVAVGDRSPTAYRAHCDHFVAQTDGVASLRATSMPQVQPPGRWPGAHLPARVRQRPRTGSARPTPAGPTPPWRAAWDAEGRAVRVENRTVQDDACAALGPTAQRVGDYVQRANAAAGVTAAAQAGNETLATLVARLQVLQAQGLTDGRREVERLARDQAEWAYGQGQRRAVRSGWDDPAPPAGAVDEPFPLAGN